MIFGKFKLLTFINKLIFHKKLSIIQSLWIGNELSVMEKLCIESFLKNGHPFHLYVYDHVGGVPKGTIIKDANKILPSSMIFKYKDHDSYAGFADMFRYKLLFEKGNYWVDTDIVCLQPLTSKAKYIFAAEKLDPNDEMIGSNNCLIKAPVGSAIMKYCFEEAKSKESDKIKWGETGPFLLTSAIEKFDMKSYMATPEEYCPIHWYEWNSFIDESIDKKILFGSKTVHFWNEMWRRENVNKSENFNENCIYEWLKKKYLN